MAAYTCHSVSFHEGRLSYQGGYGGCWSINAEIRGKVVRMKGLRAPQSSSVWGIISLCR